MGDKTKLTTADFHTSKEYLACTPKQRVWVDTFLATQDATVATQTAYTVTGESARTLTYAVRDSHNVRAAVNAALGRSEQEAFLEEIQRDIRRAPAGSDRRVRAMAMYARMKWGDTEAAAVQNSKPQVPAMVSSGDVQIFPPKFKVGEICQQDGVDYIVTKVSEDGEVLDAKEAQ